MSNLPTIKEVQDKVITSLMEALNTLQSAVEDNGIFADVKQISYNNDLIDELEVLYFRNSPDGDLQNRLVDNKEPKYTFEDAYNSLTVRINNFADAVVTETVTTNITRG